MKALSFRVATTKSGVEVSTLNQSAIKSSSAVRLTASPGFIATKVALLQTIKHLYSTWHIWQTKVFTDTPKMFILTSEAFQFYIFFLEANRDIANC